MKFLLWAQVLEQVVFFLLATRYLRLPGEWFWWTWLGFWILAGLGLSAWSALRPLARRMNAGTVGLPKTAPVRAVPAAKEE